MSVDPGHGGLAELGHIHEEVRQLPPLEIAVELGLLAAKAVQVSAGAEERAGAGEHDDTHRGVALGFLKGCAQLDHHVVAEGVAGIGAVDRHRGDGVAPSVEQVLQLHAGKYMKRP